MILALPKSSRTSQARKEQAGLRSRLPSLIRSHRNQALEPIEFVGKGEISSPYKAAISFDLFDQSRLRVGVALKFFSKVKNF